MGPCFRRDDIEFVEPLLRKQTPGRSSRSGAAILSREKDLRRVEAGYRLHLEIFLEAVLAPLAAVAGLLVTAERRRAVVWHALQIDVAGADLAADLAGALTGTGRD